MFSSQRAMMVVLVAAMLPHSGATASSYWNPSLDSQPLVVSELGWGVPPNITENTAAAFEQGLKLGASGVEVTARLTTDGKIALHHDAIAKNGVAVMESSFDQLPAGTLELAEYFEICGDYGMNIMIQNNRVTPTGPEPGYDPTNRVAEVIVQRVLDAGLADKVLISAFDIDTVAHGREVCGDCGIRFAWLAISWQMMRSSGIPASEAPAMNSSQYLDEIEGRNLHAFNMENLMVDRVLLEEAAARGIQLFVWWLGVPLVSTEKPARMQQLANCGMTGFITPRVEWALDAQIGLSPMNGTACEGFGDESSVPALV